MKRILSVLSSLMFAGMVLAYTPVSTVSTYVLQLTTVQYTNPTLVKKPIRRAPARPVVPPTVTVTGHTLTFDSPLSEGQIVLLNEDGEEELTLNVTEGTTTVTFPEFISGYYIINIIQDQYMFGGEIEF